MQSHVYILQYRIQARASTESVTLCMINMSFYTYNLISKENKYFQGPF